MKISEFQKLIRRLYHKKDEERGIEGSFRWFVEEVGELARCLRQFSSNEGMSKELKGKLKEEFADTFAWLVSLASLTGIDLEEAAKKYKNGCPRCSKKRCVCQE